MHPVRTRICSSHVLSTHSPLDCLPSSCLQLWELSSLPPHQRPTLPADAHSSQLIPSELPAGPGAAQSEAPALLPHQRCPRPAELVSDAPADRASADSADCHACGSMPSQQQRCSSDAASQLPTDMEVRHPKGQPGASQLPSGTDRELDSVWPHDVSHYDSQLQISHPHSQPGIRQPDVARTVHDAWQQPGSSSMSCPPPLQPTGAEVDSMENHPQSQPGICKLDVVRQQPGSSAPSLPPPSQPIGAAEDPMEISHPGSQHAVPSARESIAASSQLPVGMHESQVRSQL